MYIYTETDYRMVEVCRRFHILKFQEQSSLHIQNLPASAPTWNQSDLNILRLNKPSTTIKIDYLSYFG